VSWDSDSVFSEDQSADEEQLAWRYTDEGVEIDNDCLGCAASSPVTFAWSEIMAMHLGKQVPGIQRSDTQFGYTYMCKTCYRQYCDQKYNTEAAKKAALKTIFLDVGEVAKWFGKAQREVKKKRPQAAQQPAHAPQAPAPAPAHQPPVTAPAASVSKHEAIANLSDYLARLGQRPAPGQFLKVPVPRWATMGPFAGKAVVINHLGQLVKQRRR